MGAKDWVARANARLKGRGCSLELSGKFDNLYLRGTFPNKPWEGEGSKQRRISLKLRALTQDAVKEAELVAIEVSLALNKGCFDWARFGDIQDPNGDSSTITYWAERFKEDKLRTGKISDYTWKYSYQNLIDKLPTNTPVTQENLMAWILEHDPSASTMRRKYLSVALGIANLAKIETDKLKQLTRENQSKVLNPRFLLSDSQIESTALSISHEQWAWVYKMLATYGLRPHEIYKLDYTNFPDIRVSGDTKTGERLVPPLYPEWVKKFNLEGYANLPENLNWGMNDPNWKLGRKIGQAFEKKGLGYPYNLRHCYARRCLELGLTSDVSAALLGHSREIHENRYRAFISSSTYLEVAKRIASQRL